MSVYVTLFAALSALALSGYWKQGQRNWLAAGLVIFFTWFIGYRYEIGVDWVTYEIMFFDVSRASLRDALGYGDSGYSLVNWIAARLGGQVWDANLICAAIFSIGLIRFCGSLPRPGLALAVAVPTLIIITAMGYTRQAVAVGAVMMAFSQFRGTISWRWLVWLVVGLLFHRSVIFVFPIFLLAGSHRRWLTILIGGVVGAALLSLVVLQNVSGLLSLYFEGDIDSSGALPRTVIGALVGALFFLIRDGSVFGARVAIVRNVAIGMVLLLPLYFLVPSSTVIDRIGILFVPFQSAIVAGLATNFTRLPTWEALVNVVILSFYGAILGIWLIYATFANFWIPYENVVFMEWI